MTALNRCCQTLAHEEELRVSEHLSEFATVVSPPSRLAREGSSAHDLESEDKVVVAGGLACLSLYKFVWTASVHPLLGQWWSRGTLYSLLQGRRISIEPSNSVRYVVKSDTAVS